MENLDCHACISLEKLRTRIRNAVGIFQAIVTVVLSVSKILTA